MDKTLLLAAIGCGRLPGIINIMKRHDFVLFGTMDAKNLSYFRDRENSIRTGVSVNFYETG